MNPLSHPDKVWTNFTVQCFWNTYSTYRHLITLKNNFMLLREPDKEFSAVWFMNAAFLTAFS